jgi:hypothetical protein
VSGIRDGRKWRKCRVSDYLLTKRHRQPQSQGKPCKREGQSLQLGCAPRSSCSAACCKLRWTRYRATVVAPGYVSLGMDYEPFHKTALRVTSRLIFCAANYQYRAGKARMCRRCPVSSCHVRIFGSRNSHTDILFTSRAILGTRSTS